MDAAHSLLDVFLIISLMDSVPVIHTARASSNTDVVKVFRTPQLSRIFFFQ